MRGEWAEELYALPWSRVYHRLYRHGDGDIRPHFRCNASKTFHDLMKCKLLTELRGKERLCKKCDRL